MPYFRGKPGQSMYPRKTFEGPASLRRHVGEYISEVPEAEAKSSMAGKTMRVVDQVPASAVATPLVAKAPGKTVHPATKKDEGDEKKGKGKGKGK